MYKWLWNHNFWGLNHKMHYDFPDMLQLFKIFIQVKSLW